MNYDNSKLGDDLPSCEACGKQVEQIYPDTKHTLCDECGENHASEGFQL